MSFVVTLLLIVCVFVIVGLVIFVRNQLKKITQLQNLNEELLQTNKSKDKQLEITAQNLKAPINSIIGLTGSLIGGATGQLSQETRDNLDLVVTSARGISKLANDIHSIPAPPVDENPVKGSLQTSLLSSVQTGKPDNNDSDGPSLVVAQTQSLENQTLQAKEINPDMNQVLVVAQPINQQLLMNQLSASSFQLSGVTNKDTAMARIQSGAFDLVMLDIEMAKLDGFEFVLAIRKLYALNELPIILLGDTNQTLVMAQGFSCGANDFIAIPCDDLELLARLQALLDVGRLTEAYTRFAPVEFLKHLQHESVLNVRLGDQTQAEMTVMYLDIRDFSAIADNMTPKQNFDFLNEYLSYVIPSIHRNKGFIYKFLGDTVMALFPTTPDDAVIAAIEILKQISLFNEKRGLEQKQAISIGIGLDTGDVMLGTIGDEQRMDGTVISDAVKLAARLEGLSKLYGASLLVSQLCFEKLSPDNAFNQRPLGKLKLQDESKTLTVLEIFDGDDFDTIDLKQDSLEIYEQAMSLYFERDFEEAAYLFKQVLKRNPKDQTAAKYHHRSAQFMVDGVDSNWDGTERRQG